MPRDRSVINMGIWNDGDFRSLPPQAQHLYFVLWTHPGLSYCGVLDWRPGRLTASSEGWDLDDFTAAADCLQARHFIVIDETTEECLIRSYVRWDGLMKQPRVAVSFANAYTSVGSNLLRGVIIDELVKLAERSPDLAGLAKPQVVAMLGLPRISAKASVSVSDPFGDGFTHRFTHEVGDRFGDRFAPSLGETEGSVSGKVSGSPTPSPSPLLLTPNSNKHSSADADGEFEDFYRTYPRRIGRGQAVRAWKTARKKADARTIVAAAAVFRARWVESGKTDEFLPHPSTWLNGERWLDEPPEPPHEPTPSELGTWFPGA